MEEPRSLTRDDLHGTYVQQSIRELQRMVKEKEDELVELRQRPRAPLAPAASLDVMQAAYAAAGEDEPFLPFADSVLPALLALRKTFLVRADSQAYLASQGSALDKARKQLELETAYLADQKALRRALEARVAALRSGLAARQQTTPGQRRREKRDELQARQRRYDADTSALLATLRRFIQDRLGPMLAAEELGGPVVGAMVDVQADDLAAGFSAQGRLRKGGREGKGKTPSRNAGKTRAAPDKNQRRIDDMWGPSAGGAAGQEEGSDGDGSEDGEGGEGVGGMAALAAGEEMQELTEELLNALADAQGDSTAAYVSLARESAAARFLVRSKVAQFHPRDASKLRLVDFGRELDS